MRSVERTIQRWYFYWFDRTYPTYTETETYDKLIELGPVVGKGRFKGSNVLPMYGTLPGATQYDMIAKTKKEDIVRAFIDCMKMLDAITKGDTSYKLDDVTKSLFTDDDVKIKLSYYRYPAPTGGRRSSAP